MTEEKEKGTALTKSKAKKEKEVIIQYRGEPVTITFGDIKQLICPLAEDQEVAVFLRTCQSLNLNPFASEIYLIKYSEKDKAATVIAIDAYLKASETNPEYNGHEAGVILKDSSGKLELREGAFVSNEEHDNLVGGWARVFRKDREHPFYMAVSKTECVKIGKDGHPTQFWQKSKQPLMLRKTALKRALVESFPGLFSGAYSNVEFEEMPEGTLPPAFVNKNGDPAWNKFWTKLAEMGYTNKEEVHTILGVASLKDWVDSGKTLEDAITKLRNIKANTKTITLEFDQLPLASGPSPEIESELPTDKKLLEGWGIVCETVKRLNITDKQVRTWFEHYNLNIGVDEFLETLPPDAMTHDILNRFQDSLTAYEANLQKGGWLGGG